MALRTLIDRRKSTTNNNDDDDHDENNRDHHEFDEEIEATEDDLIENYRFLTKHCGVLRQSPTTGVLNTIQQQREKQQTNQSLFLRPYSSISETHNNNSNDFECSLSTTKQRCSPLNDLNNNNNINYSTTISRVPPTIYYDDKEDDGYSHNRSFSIVKLFARMKTRLKHDRRYQSKSSHELLCEADPQEWYELTKNVRTVLTKALLPDGGYDTLMQRTKSYHKSQSSYKKSRDYDPVLYKDNDDDDDKIDLNIDDELNTEGDEDFDEIIWKKFVTCSRGFNYRRNGLCKAVDRQQYQGQLVYFYGVANNILIDENLKASGLG